MVVETRVHYQGPLPSPIMSVQALDLCSYFLLWSMWKKAIWHSSVHIKILYFMIFLSPVSFYIFSCVLEICICTMFKIHTNNHALFIVSLGLWAIIIQFTNSLSTILRKLIPQKKKKKEQKKLTYLVIFMQNRLLFLQLGSEANIRGLYISSGYPLGQGPGFRCPWLGLYCIHNCKLW